MSVLFGVAALVAGLIAGFLVNLIATRLAAGHPLLGPLTCTRSKHPVAAWQVLPLVGYALQRGRCSGCGKLLPASFPLTEASLGLFFLCLYTLEGLSVSFVFHALYVSTLMLVLVLDWKHRDIYLSVIGLGGLVALVGSLLLPGVGPWSAILGAVVAGGFFLVAYLVARIMFRHIQEPLGSGDVFLALLMGLMLGFPNIVGALVLGPLIAGGVSIFLLATGRSKLGDFIPYGVSLCVAAILFLLNPSPLADALHLPVLGEMVSGLIGGKF